VAEKKKKTRPAASGGLPSREEILSFIRSSPAKAGKREIARAFNIKGGARIALKRLLSEMAQDGTLAGNRKELRAKGELPPSPCSRSRGATPMAISSPSPSHGTLTTGRGPRSSC
jgi:ribonuclease R